MLIVYFSTFHGPDLKNGLPVSDYCIVANEVDTSSHFYIKNIDRD